VPTRYTLCRSRTVADDCPCPGPGPMKGVVRTGVGGVKALGHEVIAREVDVTEAGPATVRERPDVALVGLGVSSEHALDLIDKIVHEATCPVIALLHAPDPTFVTEAPKRGVFAYIDDDEPARLAKRNRDRSLALRGIPQPRGSVRTPRPHRTRQGNPDGTPLDRRGSGVRPAPHAGA
jgi:hypothetical protein